MEITTEKSQSVLNIFTFSRKTCTVIYLDVVPKLMGTKIYKGKYEYKTKELKT